MTDDRELRHSIIMRHERTRTVIEDPHTGAQQLILQLRREIEALRSQPCARCAERGEA